MKSSSILSVTLLATVAVGVLIAALREDVAEDGGVRLGAAPAQAQSTPREAAELERVPATVSPEGEELAPAAPEELVARAERGRRAAVPESEEAQAEETMRILQDRITFLGNGTELNMTPIVLGELTTTSGQLVLSGESFRYIVMNPTPALREGLNTTHHQNGEAASQGHVQAGLKVGVWTTWHANGKKASEGRYVYGKAHGSWTYWHASGEKQAEGELLYGEREGAWTEYHEDGTRKETATYVDGKRDGRVVTWHASGERRSDSFYSYGRQHLDYREWHPGGAEAVRGSYDYGKQVGRWKYTDAEGVLDEEKSGVYEEGQKARD